MGARPVLKMGDVVIPVLHPRMTALLAVFSCRSLAVA